MPFLMTDSTCIHSPKIFCQNKSCPPCVIALSLLLPFFTRGFASLPTDMIAPIPTYILYPAAVVVSVIISLYAVKKVIYITLHRGLFDIPDNIRKIHGTQIPSLGGIGIFAGYMIASAFFMYLEWYYVVAASVILFFTGIYDDIMNMRPSKKLVAQLIASAITVFLADIRIISFYGIAGIWELHISPALPSRSSSALFS